MVNQGISPDVVAFSALIDSLCKQQLTSEAEKLVGLMIERGVEPDLITYTALLQGYVLQDRLDDEASDLLERIALKGLMSNVRSILINGYCKAEPLRLCTVEKMMKQGLKPNDTIFRILLKASSNCENPDEGKKIISEMRDGKKKVEEKQ